VSDSAIAALWNARSVAVIGASQRPGSVGGRIVGYLRASGYEGRVYPVHPTARTVGGFTAYPSVRDIDDGPQLAVIVVSARWVSAALDDCLAAGVSTVIIGSSGFADAGNAAAEAELAARARDAGVRLLGPNCIGSANLHSGLIASFSPFFDRPPSSTPGDLAVVSHSGGVGFGIASLAAERGLRPGWVVTTGNEADIGAGEVLCALAAEPRCRRVVAFLESLPARSWLERLRHMGVPVAAIVSGSSPAGAAAAITRKRRERSRGAESFVLSRNGIARASDVDELLDLAAGFASPPPRGPRVGVVTTSGGAGVLACDAVSEHGLRMPQPSSDTAESLRAVLPSYATVGNPVDVTATVAEDAGLFTRALSIMAADDAFDAIVVCLCVLGGKTAAAAEKAIVDTAKRGKPVALSRTGSDNLAPGMRQRLADAGVGVYPTPARAVAVLAKRHRLYGGS
jgi:acyl-CoA synthetase (NDP forming)